MARHISLTHRQNHNHHNHNHDHNQTTTTTTTTPRRLSLLTWARGLQVPTVVGDVAGEARRQPEPCTDDTGQHYYEVSFATVAVSSPLSSRSGPRLALSGSPACGCSGSDAGARSPLGRDQEGGEVVNEFFGTSGTRGGAVVVGAARVGRWSGCCRCSSSTRRLTFSCSSSSSSPGCARAVHDRVLDISVALRECTHSANCAEDRAWCRRPCDQQRQVPAAQRFESMCPRFSPSSQWRTFLLCSRIPSNCTGAVLGCLGGC